MVDNIGLSVSGINMAYNNSGTIGVGDADILISLKPEHAPDRRLCADPARAAAARVSRHHLLLPAGRHGQPDPELRRAGADRHPDRRQRPRRQPRLRQRPAGPDPGDPRRGRRPHPAGLPDPDAQRRRRPLAGRPGRPDREGRRQRPARPRWPAAPRPRRPTGWIPRPGCPIRSTCRCRSATSARSAACRTCRSPPAAARPSRSCWAAWRRIKRSAQRRGGVALQHAAGDRHLRHHPGPRPRRGGRRHPQGAAATPRTRCPRARRPRCAARCRP